MTQYARGVFTPGLGVCSEHVCTQLQTNPTVCLTFTRISLSDHHLELWNFLLRVALLGRFAWPSLPCFEPSDPFRLARFSRIRSLAWQDFGFGKAGKCTVAGFRLWVVKQAADWRDFGFGWASRSSRSLRSPPKADILPRASPQPTQSRYFAKSFPLAYPKPIFRQGIALPPPLLARTSDSELLSDAP